MTKQQTMISAGAVTLLALLFIGLYAEPGGGIFWHLVATQDVPAAWLLMVILLIGALWPWSGHWPERLVRGIDRQRYSIVLIVGCALSVSTFLVYRNHPLSMDEYAAWFQASVFAAGKLHGTFPVELLDMLIPPQFQNQFLMVNRETGAVTSVYWPTFSLILAPFMAVGAPWACNPTLTALSLLLIRRLTNDIAGSGEAACLPGWAMLFALASPAFIVNGISYYSMPAHLLLNLAFAWLLLIPTPRRLILAGVIGGMALTLHNPFPHTLFALPWIVWLGLGARGCHKSALPSRGISNLCWLALGYLPILLSCGLGWMLWQQHMMTPLHPTAIAIPTTDPAPWAAPYDQAMVLVRGLLRPFVMPSELLVYARLGGFAKLWLWSAPLMLLLAWQGARQSAITPLRLLGAATLCTAFGYFFVPFSQGHGWGYRYFHAAFGALPILAAVGIAKLAKIHSPDWGSYRSQVAIVTLASLVLANGFHLAKTGAFVAAHLAQQPPQADARAPHGRQIMFHNDLGYYANDLIQNHPWPLTAPAVHLLERPHLDEQRQRRLVGRYFPGSYSVTRNRYGVTYTQNVP